MHGAGFGSDRQFLVARQRARLFESPSGELPHGLLHLIALHGLRWLIENIAVAKGAAKFTYSECAQTTGQAEPVRLSPKEFMVWDVGRRPRLVPGSDRLSPVVEFSMPFSRASASPRCPAASAK